MAYVYIYDVPELNAVKIGKTQSSSKDRMFDYAETHGFRPDTGSLKTFFVGPSAYDDVESILHRKIGLRKLYWGNAQELFKKGGRSYSAITEDMQRIIQTSVSDSGKVNPVANIQWGEVGMGILKLIGGRGSRGKASGMKRIFRGLSGRRRGGWF